MSIAIWIIIILLAIILIWLLKKRIKRLIFIVILLVIAFFIYGLFSPSWASKLWYNIRTFPNRVVSRFSNKSFTDYNTYKLDISWIWSEDKINLEDNLNLGDTNINSDFDLEFDIWNSNDDLDVDDLEVNDNYIYADDDKYNTNVEIIESNQNIEKINSDKNIIKSFWNIFPLKFVNMNEKIWKGSEENQDISWYSKTDLLWTISTYIEKNLWDETEILVTIEYNDEWEADKIILKTQPKSKISDNTSSIPRLSLDKAIDWIYKSTYETVIIDDESKESWDSDNNSNLDNNLIVEVEWKTEEKKENNTPTVTQTLSQKTTSQKTTQTQTNRKTSNGLSQNDIRDAEEVLWVLF